MAKRDDTGKTASKSTAGLIRSSAAEYLTFVAAAGSGGVEAVYADESIWLSQKMMATLYDVNIRTINEHLKKIFADNELQEDSVIRKFRITADDGKNYTVIHSRGRATRSTVSCLRRVGWRWAIMQTYGPVISRKQAKIT